MIIGSSRIIIKDIVGSTGGMTGNTGPTGSTGVTGATGNSAPGNKGNTGTSISTITFVSQGVARLTLTDGTTFDLGFTGPDGAFDPDSNTIVLLKGEQTTNDTFSILYSDDSGERNANQVLITDSEEVIKFKKINFVSNTDAFDSVTTNSNYVSIVGKVFDEVTEFRPIGNVGEIIYQYESGKGKGARETYYDPSTKIAIVPINAQRSWINPNNSNYVFGSFASTPFTFNILGATGGTGSYQTKINAYLDNSNYRLSYIPDTYTNLAGTQTEYQTNIKIQDRLYFGVTGTVSLNYTFPELTWNKISNDQMLDSAQAGITSTNLATTVDPLNIGSCCLCSSENPEDRKCIDYMHKNYCIAIGGQFSNDSCLARVGNGDCFPEGACCLGDVNSEFGGLASGAALCRNTTYDLCLKYNGVFYPNQRCGNSIVAGEQVFSCSDSYRTCPSYGSCCVKGKCLDLTDVECALIPDAEFSARLSCAEWGNVYCCGPGISEILALSGPCCYYTQEDGTYCIDEQLPEICARNQGTFMGIGKKCSEISCCGVSFSYPYFGDSLESNLCRANFNDPCFAPGKKIQGGYLVAIIGNPNNCDTFQEPAIAYGEPVDCMCRPRGEQQGADFKLWKFKRCKKYTSDEYGVPNTSGSLVYISRTYPLQITDESFGSKCLFKVGVPIIQQLYTSVTANLNGLIRTITWPDPAFFWFTDEFNREYGPYAFDTTRANIVTEIMGAPSPGAALAKYLYSKFYEQNRVQVLWALIVAPEDAYYEIGSNSEYMFKWSEMFESRVEPGSENFNGKYFLEPISTSSIDGLMNTRLHDATSKNNPEYWFRDEDGDGNDVNAYRRFVSQNINQWPSEANKTEIETDINTFKYYYSQMWENRNPEGTVIRKISSLNEQNYLGYSDWYIPSIVEMNHIARNLLEINSSIQGAGGQVITTNPYWTSTSVCRIIDWNTNNHKEKDLYVVQKIEPNRNPDDSQELINERSRYYKDQMGLTEDEALDLSLQICNGIGMTIQDFSNGSAGKQYTVRRDSKAARFRPVRRIPLVYNSWDINTDTIYNDYEFDKCKSCLGFNGT